MKILFKNTTQYSNQVYSDFLIFHNELYGFKYHATTLLITFLFAFCFVLHVKSSNTIYAIGFLLAIVLFLAWRVFHPVFITKKEYKKDQIAKSYTYTFTFYEDYFEIRHKKEFDKRRYKLYKVFETNRYFYLYVNHDYSYLIDKQNFEIGTCEEFSNFMKKKFPLKYYKK